MQKQNTPDRPYQQLQSTLIALVYVLIALCINLLLFFVFPQYSLALGLGVLFITALSVILTIRTLSVSETAIAYGGFVHEMMQSNDVIKRIEDALDNPLIENVPSEQFFQDSPSVMSKLRSMLIENEDSFGFKRLEEAHRHLREETVELNLYNHGQVQWFNVHFKPVSLKKTEIFEEEYSIEKIKRETYFLWTLKDITAQKNMEQIFEEERRNLNNFIQNMPIGIYITDSKGNIEYANETFAQQLLASRDEILGQNIAKWNTSEHPLETFKGFGIFQTQSGTKENFYLIQNIFKENDELKIKGYTLQELPDGMEVLESLNDSLDKINWLFRYAPTGILFINHQKQIEKANAKAAEILGTTLKDLQEQNLSHYFQDTTLKLLEDLDSRYEKSAQKSKELHKIESRLKNNKIVRIITAPQQHKHTKAQTYDGLILYLTDATEQKDLELKFAQAQKMQAMGQLAGGVAHDFNNLLTAMIGFCDLLLQRHSIGDPSYADLTQIKQTAIRATRLVRQLLAFSRQQPLKPELIDVTENFMDLSQMLKRILGGQIQLEFQHGSDLGYIRVDPVQFSQVIINLAVNAKDAMEGKGKLSISTYAETLREPYQFGADIIAPGEFVVINVTDTGCGIPPENLNRIFEPFFSTKENVVGSGTGLGLAMVYGIVRQTEGFIKVQSTLKKGTTFSIHLPRFTSKDVPEAEKPQSTESPQTPLLTSLNAQNGKLILGLNVSKIDHSFVLTDNLHKTKILFVEDEDSVRTFAVRALKKKGFDVCACENAEAALELLEKDKNFDLLITDMMMQGLNGVELAKKVIQQIPNIKVIVSSGYSEEIFRHEIKDCADFGFIAKPYSLGDLTKKVQTTLEGESQT